ncbi:MAG: MscL family protein, partial [Clostridia bacterium]|nr:MscL family protein [Clostridia bacterium]
MKKFFQEFKKFISRGNVIDMAVGVIIASAFTAIVTAVTGKVIMPLINWLLAVIVGGNGLDSVYTFLKKVYVLDEFGMETSTVDYANSIYIDWGALIVAIINFFLIAL